MNLAFPAALFFIFLLPGFLLRDSFRSPEAEYPDSTPFAKRVVWSFLLALLLNALWCRVAVPLTAYRISWEGLLLLVSGDRGTPYENAVRSISSHPEGPLWYILSLSAFAWGIGTLARHLIRECRLDQEGRPLAGLLRSDTPWWYLFTGHDKQDQPDGVVVTAAVEQAKESYLYVGRLVEYYLTKDGAIDRLVIAEAARRPLSADRKADETGDQGEPDGDPGDPFYPISGDYFVLRGNEIRTLNIRYFKLALAAN